EPEEPADDEGQSNEREGACEDGRPEESRWPPRSTHRHVVGVLLADHAHLVGVLGCGSFESLDERLSRLVRLERVRRAQHMRTVGDAQDDSLRAGSYRAPPGLIARSASYSGARSSSSGNQHAADLVKEPSRVRSPSMT